MDILEKDGQPSVNGLFVRSVDAISGEVTDMDVKDGHHRVKVEFPHDKVDTYRTTFDPDCFRDSFAERKPVMCWQHDLRDPIGTAEEAQVLRLHNELVGRFSKFDEERGLFPVPNAYRAYTQLRDGELKDFSFGFKDPQYEPHRSIRGVRNIRRAFMKEFSPVTIGSIPGAGAADVREEDVMAQHTVEEIIRLRDAHLLTEEAAAEAIRAILDPELASKITILTPGGSGATEEELAGAGARGEGDELEVPSVLNANEIMAALPESYQRALADYDCRVFLVVGDEEWGPVGTQRAQDDGVLQMAAQIELAMRHGAEWLNDVDQDTLSDEMRQASDLFLAGGKVATEMLNILDPEGTSRAAAEDMDSVPVKCEQCGGSGKVDEDADGAGGKVCPRCKGSGVEAEERAAEEEVRVPYWQDELYLRFVSADDRKDMAKSGVAMDNGDFPIPDKGHLSSALGHFSDYTGDKKAAKAHIQKRAKALGVDLSKDDFDNRADMPEGAKACAKCDGEGKLPAPKDGGHRLTCPDCHGKGFTRAAPDDDDDSEDDEADESGDGSPSGEGAAAGEDTGDTPAGDGGEDDDDETERMRQQTLRQLDRTLGTA